MGPKDSGTHWHEVNWHPLAPRWHPLAHNISLCNTKKHSSVVKRTLGKSHDFDCAFDYDLIGQILFDFRSHSHLTFLREVEVMTLTLVMTKVMTTTF